MELADASICDSGSLGFGVCGLGFRAQDLVS